jgi:hypothetical protein
MHIYKIRTSILGDLSSMSPLTLEPTHTATSDTVSPDEAVIGTVSRLLAPLARLCLANGVTFAAVEEMLKRAFVQEANNLHPGAPSHGTVSRISTATGIRRREVTRLIQSESPVLPAKPPHATQVFARWTTDPALQDQDGAPCPLKRQGTVPSFETLAQSVTRDVHPRSMLDELIRLGLASYDEANDSVMLTRTEFVPDADARQMLDFLGDNVGDHLDAAVANVLKDGCQHFEQAVFADELSVESIETLRPLVSAQWQALRDALVPTLTELIEADARAGRPQNQRVRIGLYSFTEPTPDIAASTTESTDSTNDNIVKGVPQ